MNAKNRVWKFLGVSGVIVAIAVAGLIVTRLGMIPVGIQVRQGVVGAPSPNIDDRLYRLIANRSPMVEIRALVEADPGVLGVEFPGFGFPLHNPAVRERPELYEYLIVAGADPTVRVPLDQLILPHVQRLPSSSILALGLSPLDLAARDGEIEFLRACIDLAPEERIRSVDLDAALAMAEEYRVEAAISFLSQEISDGETR